VPCGLREQVDLKQVGQVDWPGANFTNIFQAAFSYEIVLRSFSLLTVWLCKFLSKEYWRKSCL